jgi:RNA polymerase sigma-70 factor (ECF subfamily)
MSDTQETKNERMLSEAQLVKNCLAGKADSQELLYRRFASRMFGVCLRYAKNKMEAEDIMQEGFIKVYQNLKHFRNEGSLEGWVRRIMVNTSINYYKSNLKYLQTLDIDDCTNHESVSVAATDNISLKTLLNLIQKLPEGYRMVFNMYVIEGYSHREIAETLGVSENTSKSQLSRARKVLQEKLKTINAVCYEQTA